MEPHKALLDRARRILRHFGLQVKKAQRAEWDLEAHVDGRQFLVEVKEVRPYRRSDARGRVADGVLQLRELSRSSQARPLLAVGFERLSDGALEDLTVYLGRYAPDVSWLLFDQAGRAALQLTGEPRRETAPSEARARVSTPRPVNPFSPLNQWLLKVLLVGGMSPRFWGGPNARPSNVSEWARLAGASQPQASLLAAELQRQGHLVRRRNELRPLHVQRLLDAWAAQAQPSAVRLKPLYPLAPSESPERWVLERLAQQEGLAEGTVVAGPEACRLLEIAVANVDVVRLYLTGPLREWMDRLELVTAEPGEPSVEVVVVRDPRPYTRGAVRRGRLHVADVLQCYLDSRHAPLRGEEQADFIRDRVLQPWFEDLGWH